VKISQLRSYAEDFVDSGSFKANSQSAYRTDLRSLLKFLSTQFSAEFSTEDITRQMIFNWLQREYTHRAASRRAVNIRQFMLWLAESKAYPIDPDWRLSWKLNEVIPLKAELPPALSSQQLYELFQHHSLNLSQKLVISLIMDTASTLEEICQLRASDISVGNLPYVTLGELQGRRLAPISRHTKKLLKKLLPEDQRDSDNYLLAETGSSASSLSVLLRRKISKILNQDLSITDLQQYALRKMRQNKGLGYTMKISGKKRVYSLVKLPKQELDMNRLKLLHQRAFSE